MTPFWKKKQKKIFFSFFYGFFINFVGTCTATSYLCITKPNCALDSRKSLCLYIPVFQRQVKHVPKCKWIQLTKLPWIPRTNSASLKIQNISGFNLQNLREFRVQIPLAYIFSALYFCCGFHSCNQILQMKVDSAFLCELCLQFADSAYEFLLQFLDSTYSCEFHNNLKLLSTYTVFC